MTGVAPHLVAEAVRLGLIEKSEADRYLRGPTPTKPYIVPSKAPPPERVTWIRNPNGRMRRVRSKFTRGLLRAGVLDADVVKRRRPRPAQESETA
jgi:hypothetical protein